MVAPAVAASVNVTLLPESSRRVGTAWPGAISKAESGGGKGIKERFAGESFHHLDAALHNRLKLFESTNEEPN
jgi:hypothetical protein